jgi:hypothetical protein
MNVPCMAVGIFEGLGSEWNLPSIADRMDASGDCWEWQGALSIHGYGQVKYAGRSHLVHRAVWSALVGEIPVGFHLDHLCRNHACCNPEHLRAVTPRVNALENSVSFSAVNSRKSHCPRGHPFAGANLRVRPSGGRACRACVRDASRRYAERKRRKDATADGAQPPVSALTHPLSGTKHPVSVPIAPVSGGFSL